MSSDSSPRGAAPAYDDAEKGVSDSVVVYPVDKKPAAFPVDEKNTVFLDEKKDVAPFQPPQVKRDPYALVKGAPKREATKLTVFLLWYNMYRKLFTIAFTANIIMFGFAVSGHWPYATMYAGAFAVANFNTALLVRNEIFGRFLYLFCNTFFAKWAPLWFRLTCTNVLQHLGGIHTGCAVSGIIWITYKVVNTYRNLVNENNAILVVGLLTNVTLIVTAVAAFPWVRNNHHNVFERNHRFAGWTALFLTWAFTIMGDLYHPNNKSWVPDGRHLVRQQDFWYVMLMTTWIVLPWICTREVPVDIELPSPKVAVVRFRRGMQQGLLGRISRSAVKEYHAFGIISEGPHAKYHYMICGVQGDFTRSLVNDPPKTLWTRELKFAGISNTSTLYKRGIRICTGTGIGAALSTCIQSPNWFLIWIGSDQEKTFGPTISGLIHRHVEPERLLLWDSKARGGRPDTMKILKDVYKSWNAEVVFITSNYIGNTEMMQGCKEEGIPCFGTLWDFR
ncbi:uncharacterized protein TRAVEDRAFT_19223 [Trametes versicolor FP-101664 SS1]|uniref:uncharacterized protein n=1 Tax=Trametes versicolor (strain FP-101664) TaxID=717944 RepID=UPI000462344A|nr:uncharacterized protein TRAVEDRAFT_19223 [Trametes versicolor FP-101664 SS1]EIW60578.1 hypothetical protein TRAVEDRAFT_19223 [Trametes versicolor FP-101664 SS1]